jgi:hypothetical protein
VRGEVAVAYVGAGAARLLPLRLGSRLVVDASEGAVKNGQTCPGELIRLQGRGVVVFSAPNPHAKVFVFGRTAFIGSANASGRSEKVLHEAMIRTSERKAVKAARGFVKSLCLHELTPKVLKRLEGMYRPPRIVGAGSHRAALKRGRPRLVLPRVFVVRLHHEEWSDALWEIQGKGLSSGKKYRKHSRSYETDSFRYTGRCPYRRGDVVVQVMDEDRGKRLVTRPANVYHTYSRPTKKGRSTFVYLEFPAGRRRRLGAVTRALGRGSKRRLLGGGLVSRTFAESLFSVFSG